MGAEARCTSVSTGDIRLQTFCFNQAQDAAANMTTNAQYEPLDSVGGEIRVLELRAAAHTATVSAVFVSVRLDQQHSVPFHALSYMWGDVTERCDIILNGNPFAISRRLMEILRALRKEAEPLRIWIDAICINQDDLAERAAQVQLMRKIYREAAVVRVWLDEDIDEASPAFTKLSTLNAQSTIQDLGDTPDFWDPVVKIFQNAYWKRVWIQQEISNASVISVHCKATVLEAATLVHYLRLCNEMQLSNVMQSTWWDWGTKKPTVILPDKFGSSNPEAATKGSTLSTEDLDLLYTLQNVNSLNCTDDRDRVYGIMFLAKDFTEGDLEVDYSFSVARVYAEVAKSLIHKYGSTRFLLFANLHQSEKQAADPVIPTWVPDWRYAHGSGLDSKLPPMDPIRVGSRPPAKISPDGLKLAVTGVRVNVVKRIYRDEFEEDVLSQTLLHFISTCREMACRSNSSSIRSTSTTNNPAESAETDITATDEWKSVVRTLAMADYISRFEHDEAKEVLYLSASKLVEAEQIKEEGFDPSIFPLHKFLSMNEGYFGPAKAFVQFTWWTMITCLPFVAQDGRPGLTQKWGEAGDEIWLIQGCERPISLRSVGEKMYKVVGQAYLDGSNYKKLNDLVETSGVATETIELV
ncbi:hypothetical protein jhhlp_000320 [Lomentospora prolificans]|uniref:Heterokaryon incompatibility domain-containing protein n=1 Tax=Lomentospora prolificans TaxID=41688 RepID=A0A2N3NKN0_9PEZI|nr:hypothetical protein jhhlp_000320 [Lomentospora prolificans]